MSVLKGLLDFTQVLITKKNVDSESKTQKIRLLASTNVKDPNELWKSSKKPNETIDLSELEHARRFIFLYSNDDVANKRFSDNWFETVYRGIDEGLWPVFLYFLMQLPVPDSIYHFKTRAPATDYHLRGIEVNSTKMIEEIVYHLKNYNVTFNVETFPPEKNLFYYWIIFGNDLFGSEGAERDLKDVSDWVKEQFLKGNSPRIQYIPFYFICWVARKVLGYDLKNSEIRSVLNSTSHLFKSVTSLKGLATRKGIRNIEKDVPESWRGSWNEHRDFFFTKCHNLRLFQRQHLPHYVQIGDVATGENLNLKDVAKEYAPVHSGSSPAIFYKIEFFDEVTGNEKKTIHEDSHLDNIKLTTDPSKADNKRFLFDPSLTSKNVVSTVNRIAGTDHKLNEFKSETTALIMHNSTWAKTSKRHYCKCDASSE
jgi:hypothetical protein